MFAVAVSPDEAGEDALEWLMNELVEDGDEVVAIRVIELAEGGELGVVLRGELRLTRTEKANPTNQDEVREDAQTLLARVLDRNNAVDDERRVSQHEHPASRTDDETDIGHCRGRRGTGREDAAEDDRAVPPGLYLVFPLVSFIFADDFQR